MSYQRILLAGRSGVPGVEETLDALVKRLLDRQLDVYCTECTTDLIKNHSVTALPEDQLAGQIDLVVVVGGDGSLLQAAHFAADQGLPVVGINRGRLGFLTDICPKNLEEIDDILDGKHITEHRFMIDSQLTFEGKTSAPKVALNDIVLQSDGAQMIAFDVYVDEQLVYQHRADGLIIATPTGSTAYALSGGGPILQPQLPALSIVPMFPHTLSSRPIVVSINSKIRIQISPNQKNPPVISNDGHEKTQVPAGGEITVSLHEKKLTLLHPENYNYYKTLREKLNWEQSARRNTD